MNETDEYEESKPTLNDLPAKFYARDLFYKKIEDQTLITDNSLRCYQTENKK